MTAVTLVDCARPVVVDAPAGPAQPPAGATNVVEWDQVASLPWRESFDMAPLPAMVVTVERRRHVDGRSLAQVVKGVAG